MAKFNRENSRPRKDGDKKDEDKKGGRSSYKAKRSFTRNKSYRDKEKTESKRPERRQAGERGYEKRDRPFPGKTGSAREGDKPFRRERPGAARDERPAGDRKPWGREKGAERDNDERSERVKRGDSEERGSRGNKPGERRGTYRDRGDRPERDDDRPAYRGREGSAEDREDRPVRRGSGEREQRSSRAPGRGDREERPSRSREGGERGDRPQRSSGREERPSRGAARGDRDEKPRRAFGRGDRDDRPGRPGRAEREDDSPRRVKHSDFEEGRSFSKREEKADKKPAPKKKTDDEGLIRLNKYLANAGLASRREADTLIQSGAVKVNGVVVDQLGYKIKPGDKVTYGDETVKGEKKVYLLLNKPKDYITTVDDPRDRKTVMELIRGACRERVYPVGRLDRNTTGLLLFTNDGELTTKLTHPKFGVKKVYHVSLDKGLKAPDFKALVDGIELEDGVAKADDLAFVGEGKKDVGIEIHSGRNRIVRRMFEHLGYTVVKLDRVVFAGLTKKDLPRGKHRFLTAREISFLKMIG